VYVRASGKNSVHNPWIAVNSATDRVAWARLLRRAHDIALGGRGTPPVLREVIGHSWARSVGAGVDPDRPAPLVLETDQVAARFAEHPLAGVAAIVRHLLGAAAEDARHLMALSDGDGMLLWVEGHPSMLEAAIEPRFLPGSLCSEAALGTNAVGTALALDHAVQVFSAEHFNRLLHGWSGSAAPIHRPASGAVLGALAVCGSFRTAHPHTLSLVSAAARAAEAQLACEQQRRDAELTARYIDRLPPAGRRRSALVTGDGRVLFASPPGWLAGRIALPAEAGSVALGDGTRALVEPLGDGASIVWGVRARERRVPRRTVRIRALGVDPPDVLLDGRRLTLSLRHVELLVLLALRPEGLSAGGLARALHGDGGKPVTVRAEVTRLRRALGDIVLGQPYRLAADVRADFLDVERLLRRGDVDRALTLSGGPLLASSHAPGIAAARTHLEEALDTALRRSGDGVAGRLRVVDGGVATRVA
jgi:hypothetical protein